jgi:hypothetical protein
MGEQIFCHWKTTYCQYQMSCCWYRYFTRFHTLYITRTAVISLSHPDCARVSTTRWTCNMCILSMDLQQSAEDPMFTVYSTNKLCFSRTTITIIHNEHIRWKSSCSSISLPAMAMFHQAVGWDFRWLPRSLSHFTIMSWWPHSVPWFSLNIVKWAIRRCIEK